MTKMATNNQFMIDGSSIFKTPDIKKRLDAARSQVRAPRPAAF